MGDHVGHVVPTRYPDLVLLPMRHLLHPRLPDVDQRPVTLGYAVIPVHALLALGRRGHRGVEAWREGVPLRGGLRAECLHARLTRVHERRRACARGEVMHRRAQRTPSVVLSGALHDNLLCAANGGGGGGTHAVPRELRLGRGVHRDRDVARVRPPAAPAHHLRDSMPRHPRLLVRAHLGRLFAHRAALDYVRLVRGFVLRPRDVEPENEHAREGVVVRLKVGRVPRIGVDLEQDGVARRGDDRACGDLICGGVAHGELFWVGRAVWAEGEAASGAGGLGPFEVNGCRPEELVGLLNGLERWVRGVFMSPFGRET